MDTLIGGSLTERNKQSSWVIEVDRISWNIDRRLIRAEERKKCRMPSNLNDLNTAAPAASFFGTMENIMLDGRISNEKPIFDGAPFRAGYSYTKSHTRKVAKTECRV